MEGFFLLLSERPEHFVFRTLVSVGCGTVRSIPHTIVVVGGPPFSIE